MQNQWTPPQIITAVLGVLGFVLSCYNYLIVQRRKEKEDQSKRLSDIRFRFGQQRQKAMELVVAVQLAALRKKQVLLDIQSQARQAARRDSVTLLQKPVADAEREASEAESRMKELLSLVLPKDANVEVIQELEDAYGKIIIGLQTELASRHEELKQVDNIVEIVKDDIAKSQRQGG